MRRRGVNEITCYPLTRIKESLFMEAASFYISAGLGYFATHKRPGRVDDFPVLMVLTAIHGGAK